MIIHKLTDGLVWIKQNPVAILEGLRYLVVAVIVGLVVYNSTAAYTAAREARAAAQAVKVNGENIELVLSRLVDGEKLDEEKLTLLLKNNAQQTQILCSIVLGQALQLTTSEEVNVEAICRERIRQATEQTAEADGSGAGTGQSSSGSTNRNSTLPSNGSGSLEGGQSDNSQNPPNDPDPPDNDGIIIDLPLLPKLHIPSPL
jgi:hypothetical protein